MYGESCNTYHETMETYHFVRAGVVLVLYFRTMVILLRNRGEHKKFSLFYALFSSMMVFSITVWVATQALFGEKMWLLDSDFPGGPDAYWNAHIWIWYMDWAATGIIALQLMTDALMVGHARGCHNVSHSVGSRSTAVGLYGMAVVPSSYPSFCGCLPSVSITPALRPHGRFIPCSTSLGRLGRLDQHCARKRLFHWYRCPTQSHILDRLSVPECYPDVHDMLPYSAPRQEGPGASRA